MKQSCSPRWELSNSMSHATCTRGNWGDFWLLVIGGQITNLTLNPSFSHNLCLKCPNGSYEPILNIYVPRNFQLYKKNFNPLSFDLFNGFLKIRKSTRRLLWECEGCDTSDPSFKILLGHIRCRNLSLGLMTKIRGCKVAGQKGSPWVMSHAPENVREWGNRPSHSQGNSHFGNWNPPGLPNVQKAIVRVKT
jgi:hypothetical protein